MKDKLKTWLAAAGALVLLLFGTAVLPEEPAPGGVMLAEIEDFAGKPYIELQGGLPDFSAEMLAEAEASCESYSPLDFLGRPQAAMASIGPDMMPEGERESIGMIKPAGFTTVRYDDLIEDKYLYNRCHLIGWQLTGQNANEQNLITGTRYMNVEGMLPFENRIASYVRNTGNHVLYRVTPVYEGDNLLCSGLQLEACSVEDGGEGLRFHVFVYNVQPGIEIDYATGESCRMEVLEEMPEVQSSAPAIPDDCTYVLNRNSHKFHLPFCESVTEMKEKNRVFSSDDRDAVLAQGYSPCQRCKP